MREKIAMAVAIATESATPFKWFVVADCSKSNGKALMVNCTKNESTRRNAPTMKSAFCDSISSEMARPRPHIFVAIASALAGSKCNTPIEKNSAANRPSHEAMMSSDVAKLMAHNV